MIFVYIILSAILLYYAIKYGIRDGLIDRDAQISANNTGC